MAQVANLMIPWYTSKIMFFQYCLQQDSKIPAQRKECKIIQNEAEDAGRLTPVKDNNEVVEDFVP